MKPARALPKPDGELLHLCAEYHRIRATAADLPIDEIDWFRYLLSVQRVMADVIIAMPMTTETGRRAATGVALAHLADGADPFATMQ